jgi:hypothetical protein
MDKFLDALYKDMAWDIAVVIALFAFAINLIVGVL